MQPVGQNADRIDHERMTGHRMPESEAQQINVVNQVVAVTVGKAQCDKARPDVGSLGHVTGHGIDLWPCVVNLALMAGAESHSDRVLLFRKHAEFCNYRSHSKPSHERQILRRPLFLQR